MVLKVSLKVKRYESSHEYLARGRLQLYYMMLEAAFHVVWDIEYLGIKSL